MTKKKAKDKVVTGSGIKTSAGAVLLSCTLHCRVCGSSELFEWHDKEIRPEDVEGIDTLGLVMAVAHSQNWIAQRVYNIRGGKLPFCTMPNLPGPLLLRDDGTCYRPRWTLLEFYVVDILLIESPEGLFLNS